MKEKPKTAKPRCVDEMERLVVGTAPKPLAKTKVEFDAMYGRETKRSPDDDDVVGDKYGRENVGYCLGPNADYGGMKKREEKKCEYEWKYA